MKITHTPFDDCETSGHRPPHSLEEHLGAIQNAIAAAERDGIVVSVRRTCRGVAYDYRAIGTEVVEPPAGLDKLGVESIET
jgi:hypothetical protein